jgi:hypothetical protein
LRGNDPTASPAGQPGRGQSGPFARLEQAAELSADPLPAMYKMAGITGGRVFWNTNDMAMGIKAVAADSKGTYSLGFYADAETGSQWRDLNVDVKRKGVKLLHRRGYLAETVAAAPLDWTEEQWQAAIYNPIGSTGLRLNAMARLGENGGLGAAPAQQKAMLLIEIAADDLVFRPAEDQEDKSAAQVDVAVIEKLPDGNYRMQRDPMTLPLPSESNNGAALVRGRHMWDLLPGAATIRLIVRDRFTGRFGTLDLPVKDIPALAPGEMARPH